MPNQQGEYHSEWICIPCGDDFRRVAPAGADRRALLRPRPDDDLTHLLEERCRRAAPTGMPYSRPALTGTPLMTDRICLFPRWSHRPRGCAGGMVPACFDWNRPQPLKLGIHRDLIAAGHDPSECAGRWARIARRPSYQKALRVGATRLDLQGQPAGW